MKRFALLLPVLCWLTWSATARGAVVQLDPADPAVDGNAAAALVIIGLPGEANVISVAPGPPGSVRIRDEGAAIFPGANCTGGPAEVTCSGVAADALRVSVSASDADDRITIDESLAYTASSLSGGGGNDVIVGGSDEDQISGAGGDDQLDGAAGDDELAGSQGADSIHGGPGIDIASWSYAQGSVSVTLDDRPDDGGPGEEDNVWTDVENVEGGDGPNRLVGSDGPNVLDGGDSTNELIGGGGDDVLKAGFGAGGLLRGGPGRDRIDSSPHNVVDVRDGETDTVQCPQGLRRAPRADAIDKLRTCAPEVNVRSTRALVSTTGLIELRFRCGAIGRSCRARVSISAMERVIARKTITLRPGKVRATIRLNGRGRELVRQQQRLITLVEAQGFTEQSEAQPYGAQVVLRRG